MRVIAKPALRKFWERPGLAAAEGPLSAWYKVANHRTTVWRRFSDVKDTFGPRVDQVDACVVFDAGGNKYRLVTKIDYEHAFVFILKVLTHKEYDNQSAWYDECGCGQKKAAPAKRREQPDKPEKARKQRKKA